MVVVGMRMRSNRKVPFPQEEGEEGEVTVLRVAAWGAAVLRRELESSGSTSAFQRTRYWTRDH